jgi:hypothetical protein
MIGTADEFYRLRMMSVAESDGPEMEWRDDILYRRPPSDDSREFEEFRVEAVVLDDEESSVVLRSFTGPDEAHDWLRIADSDIHEMTKSEFEDVYFPKVG